MKICFYDWNLRTIGGGQRFDCKMAEYLSRKHEVDMLSFFPIDKRMLEKSYSVNLSRVRNFNYLFKEPKLPVLLLYFLNRRRIARIASSYDVFFNADGHEIIKPTARYNIMYCHFFMPKVYKQLNSLSNILKVIFVYSVKSVLKNYARQYKIYCNSNFTKRWLKKLWKVNAEVIYPPIDYPKRIRKKKRNEIISLGRITPDKNYEFIIDCFKEICKEKESRAYKLVICGSAPYKDYLNKLKESSMGYPIEFISNPSDKQIKDIYDSAKVFIQAKGLGIDEEKTPNLIEHFGMTTAEAMSYGCVPIVLNKGGYKESVENGKSGFLFNSGKEAIKRIKALLKNKRLLERMSRNARQRAKKFSLERLHKDLDRMMKKVSID